MVILNVPLHLLLSPSLALSLSLFGSGALFCALHTFHLWSAFCQRFIFPIWELRSIAMIVIIVTCGRVLAHKCAHTTLEHQVHLYISKHWTPNKRESTIFAQLDYFGRSQRCLCRSKCRHTVCCVRLHTLHTAHSTAHWLWWLAGCISFRCLFEREIQASSLIREIALTIKIRCNKRRGS